MGPGLNRAVPMALAGFLLGAAFVIVLRMLQSMDPVWDAELGLLMAAFLSTVFFVWGMGAFDPKMSAHHAVEPPEYDDGTAIVAHHADEHAEEAELEAQPVRMLSGQIWQIGFWTILLFAAILAFATLPGGFALTVSNDAAANARETAMVPIQLPFSDQIITYNGEVVLFSEFAVFIVFTGFTLLSLAAIGGVVALGVYALARGVQNVKVAGNVPLYALSSGQTLELGAGENSPAPVKARRVGDRARAITVPNLIAYAVVFPNVFIGLWLFSIFENPGRIVAAIIISHLLAQIINNNLIPGTGAAQRKPWLALALNVVVLVVGWLVFKILLDLAIQFTTGWQYSPLDPTRDALPWLSASFLAPFIVDVILNGAASYGGLGKVARLWVITMLVFQVLYIVFYGPAIGLVILGDPGRFIASGINTVIVTLLLLRTPEVTWSIGKLAGWLANLLSKIPRNVLGQK